MQYCDNWNRESFLMEDLPAGDYILHLQAPYDGGEYLVEVFCESDGDWDDITDDFHSTTVYPTPMWSTWDYESTYTSDGDDVSCSSHYDCIEWSFDNEDWRPFCFEDTCTGCYECHYCWDGVDGTCGYCGADYPLYEDEDCSLGSTFDPWWTTDEWSYETTDDDHSSGEYSTMDPWDDKDYIFSTLSCNSTVTGNLNLTYAMVFNITNYQAQDIFFSNCGSDFDTRMKLFDVNGTEIQYWAANGGCEDDDDCDNYCYCEAMGGDSVQESFLMEDLAVGDYYLLIAHYDDDCGDCNTMYQVMMSCEHDDTYEEVEDMCTYGSSTYEPYSTTEDGNWYFRNISCGETITGNTTYDDVIWGIFVNPVQQDVLFSSCESSYDTWMHVTDENLTVISNRSSNWDDSMCTFNNSDNDNNCNYQGYCDKEDRETYLFEDLDAGTYIALSWATHGEGTYGLTVECESDSDFDTNVLDLTTQEPTTAEPTSPTFEPTEIPTAYPSFMPSNEPSVSPTTAAPTQEPTTGQPTPSPSVNPSTNPSASPSMSPTTGTDAPSASPSNVPSTTPTDGPTMEPTKSPTSQEGTTEDSEDPTGGNSASSMGVMVALAAVAVMGLSM
jgi:hypothetical protein